MTSTTIASSEIAGAQALLLLGLVNYQDGSVVSRVVLKREKGNITIFAFDEGQGLSEHTSPFDALVQAELRQWFGHDPKKWEEFRQLYRAELERHPEVCDPILKAARGGAVTLVYSSHDREHNNAVALRDYVGMKLGRKRRVTSRKSAA
jgi:Protein of unknown function, DUF488